MNYSRGLCYCRSSKRTERNIAIFGYNVDFTVHYIDGHTEVGDIKGMVTQQFELRKKLFEYRFLH
ncbi:DUF1064 domain-containing protein [Lysinibacillus irui]|nr:DUF1064 domain-containing protein [Lysinibacillus irui]MEA0565824.1 DUF1064 domain-containing protein [Lysinibacillus irui]